MGNGWPGPVGIICKCLGTEPNYGLAILLPAEASPTRASWRAAGQNPFFNLRGLPTAPCTSFQTEAAGGISMLKVRAKSFRFSKSRRRLVCRNGCSAIHVMHFYQTAGSHA